MPDHPENNRIRAILNRITCDIFPDWRVKFVPGRRDSMCGYTATPYLQIVCIVNGYALWSARKWQLSWRMCDTEIVNTAYLAYQQAMQHELGEAFKLDGVAVYDPHRSVFDATKQDTRPDSINAA